MSAAKKAKIVQHEAIASGKVKADTIERLRKLDCPTVFNAVHQLTPKDNADQDQWSNSFVLDPNTQYTNKDVKCMHRPLGEDSAVVGFAVTTEVTTNEPHSKEEKNWVDYYTYLQNAAGPLVAVMKDVDTYFSHHRSAVFGDGMSTLHKRCGVEGAVCDGVLRDLDGIKKVGFPIWATGEVSGHGRFVVKAFNVPVTVGELRVEPGDLIMADSGGVVRIPLDIADKVVERAENIRGKEDVIFKWFRSDDFKAENLGTHQQVLCDAYDKEHPESFAAAQEETEWK